MAPVLLTIAIILHSLVVRSTCAVKFPNDLGIRQVFTPTADPLPPPSQTPLIIVNDFVGVLTTCTIRNVSWLYAGPSIPFSFFATNLGVLQDPPPPSLSSRPTPTFTDVQVLAAPPDAATAGTITVPIVEDFEPRASSVPWKVNVPQGWYQILARTNLENRAQSNPFYVQPGSDITCLAAAPPSSSPSSSLPGSALPSFTQIETIIPNPSAAPHRSQIIGPIIGGSMGVVCAMTLTLFYCHWCRRKSIPKRVVSEQANAWGVLNSYERLPGNPNSSNPAQQNPLVTKYQGPPPVRPQPTPSKTRRNDEGAHGRLSGGDPNVSRMIPSRSSRSTSIVSTLPSYGGLSSGPPQYPSTRRSGSISNRFSGLDSYSQSNVTASE